MLNSWIWPIIIAITLASYLAFFALGGCIALFRTALNDQLRAQEKFYWMLAQVYFPPTSIAYIVKIEKSHKFQIIAAVGFILGASFPIYKLETFQHWDKLPQFAETIAKNYNKNARAAEAHDEKARNQRHSHKHEVALTFKMKALQGRLDAAIAFPQHAKSIDIIKPLFYAAYIQYMTGIISEGDFEKLADQLDSETSSGALSEADAQAWLVSNMRVAALAKVGNKHPKVAAAVKPDDVNTPEYQAAETLALRLNGMDKSISMPDEKEKVGVSLAALSVLRDRHASGDLSSDDYNNFLKDLDSKTSAKTFTDTDYVNFMQNLKRLIAKPCHSCIATTTEEDAQ